MIYTISTLVLIGNKRPATSLRRCFLGVTLFVWKTFIFQDYLPKYVNWSRYSNAVKINIERILIEEQAIQKHPVHKYVHNFQFG